MVPSSLVTGSTFTTAQLVMWFISMVSLLAVPGMTMPEPPYPQSVACAVPKVIFISASYTRL